MNNMDGPSHQDYQKNKSVIVICDTNQDANVAKAPKDGDCKEEDEMDVQFLGDTDKVIQNITQEMKAQYDTMSKTILTRIDSMGTRINDLGEMISEMKSNAGLGTSHESYDKKK